MSRKIRRVNKLFYKSNLGWWVSLMLLLIVINFIGRPLYEQRLVARAESAKIAQISARSGILYGVAMSNYLTKSSQQQQTAYLKQIKDAGLHVVRYDLDWITTESQKGKYDWSKFDTVIKNVKASGLSSVIMLSRTPGWAAVPTCKNSTFCAPNNPADFAEFAAAAAARYKNDDVKAWEIWNEPNIVEFWKPAPNPSQYARLLSAAYKSIKKADPSAVVLMGGLSGNSVDFNGYNYIDPRPFLAQVYAANVGKPFDGIAYHPYTGTGSTTSKGDYNGWLKLDDGGYNIRSIMSKNGDTKKTIWITEYGVPTDGPKVEITDLSAPTQPKNVDHVSFEVQDQILKDMIANIKSKPWIANFDWYTLRDNVSPWTNAGGSYGLFENNNTPKPALSTLSEAANAAANQQKE